MTREEQIKQAAKAYYPSGSLHEERTVSAFVRGAKWADENPNKKLVYTKEELIKMGFSFDLNGNIRTPEECYESAVKYNEYRKQKFIKKACDWLSKTLYIHTEEIEDKHWNEIKTFDLVTSDFDSVSDFIEGFRKAMEE